MVIKEELVAVKLGLDEEKYVPHKKEIGLGHQGPRTLSIATNACRRKPNVEPKTVNFESGPGTPKCWVYSDTAVQTDAYSNSAIRRPGAPVIAVQNAEDEDGPVVVDRFVVAGVNDPPCNICVVVTFPARFCGRMGNPVQALPPEESGLYHASPQNPRPQELWLGNVYYNRQRSTIPPGQLSKRDRP